MQALLAVRALLALMLQLGVTLAARLLEAEPLPVLLARELLQQQRRQQQLGLTLAARRKAKALKALLALMLLHQLGVALAAAQLAGFLRGWPLRQLQL